MFEYYIRRGAVRLRCGYTTGTCAALAAAGATHLLLTGQPPTVLRLVTPGGVPVAVEPRMCCQDGSTAQCAVEKDGGDDPDVTTGYWIVARVCKTDTGVIIDGGEGVGRVTKPGLDQPVGAAAINRVPRQMIIAAVQAECAAAGYKGGLTIVISVPGGETLAGKTFNPMLGIVGGISILGTSGIVEPMSERAVVDTIAVEIRQAAATVGTRRLLLTPGHYGEAFIQTMIRSGELESGRVPVVMCSNFIGEALDLAADEGFEAILLVGHIGKLVKLAGGIMNTHSRQADCRRELFCAHAAIHGADQSLCRALMEAATTERCIALLAEAGLQEIVLQSLLDAVENCLSRRMMIPTGAVLFSSQYGLLGKTETAKKIINQRI